MKRSTPRIILYTTGQCSYCRQAKSFLQNNRIPFTEQNLERSKRALLEFQGQGGRGVPMILVGKRKLHGFEPKTLTKILRQSGFNV